MTAVAPPDACDPSEAALDGGPAHGEPVVLPGADPGPQTSPPDDGTDAEPADGRRARRVVLGVLAGLLAFAILVVFLLPLAAQQRQGHLRDEYRVAAPRVLPGEAAFLLQAPAIGLDQVVVRGAEPNDLHGGPGWREGSAPPGQGNTVILGKSTLWSYPFGRIDELRGGALLYLRTRDDRVYVYRVNRVRTVAGDRTVVMRANGPTRLTLVTSAGGPFSTRRVVVQATAVGAQPPVPERARVRVSGSRDLGGFDERSPGGAVLLVSGFLVIGLGALGVRELRRRYGPVAVAVVAGPAIALGVVLVLFHLDAFLPITY